MKYYLAIEKKEILPSVTEWMDLEGTVLSKISQIDKYKYCMLLLTSGIWGGGGELNSNIQRTDCYLSEGGVWKWWAGRCLKWVKVVKGPVFQL